MSSKSVPAAPKKKPAAEDSDSESNNNGFFSRVTASSSGRKSKWFASSINNANSSDDQSSSSASSTSDESDFSSDDSESDSSSFSLVKSPQTSKKPLPGDDDDSSQDSYFGSDSDDDDDSASEDDVPLDPSQRRFRWLKDEYITGKVPVAKPASASAAAPQPHKQPVAQPSKPRDDVDQAVGFRKVGGDKLPDKDAVSVLLGEDANASNVLEKLADVSRARGKKTSDRDTIILALDRLLDLAVLDFQKIKILMALTSCHFDSQGAYMNLAKWKLAASRLDSMLDLLNGNHQLILREDVDPDAETGGSPSDSTPGVSDNSFLIKGSLIGMVERLDEELTKSLMAMDLGTPEFLDRLRDQVSVYGLLLRAESYSKRVGDVEATTRAVLRRLEHSFNKPDTWVSKLHTYVLGNLIPEAEYELTNSAVLHCFADMAAFLYSHGTDRLRTRAVLCHVTYHAIHNRVIIAHDMLLMSGLQDSIKTADIATQALYNRSLVHIALGAFRSGLFRDAHLALHELLSPGNQIARELINHGTVAPLNLELIEAVYLTSSMLLEVPYMAANPHDNGKRRLLAKSFRRQFDIAERSTFQGPPENTRDHIMACARSLLRGDWQIAVKYLTAVRVWTYLGGISAATTTPVLDVTEMLTNKCKEVALTAYVHQVAGTCLTSISISHLALAFSLTEVRVRGLISQIILHGISSTLKFDGIHNALVVVSSVPGESGSADTSNAHAVAAASNRVHYLTNQLAEKLLAMADANDKIMLARAAVNVQGSESQRFAGSRRGGGRGGYQKRGGKNQQYRQQHQQSKHPRAHETEQGDNEAPNHSANGGGANMGTSGD